MSGALFEREAAGLLDSLRRMGLAAAAEQPRLTLLTGGVSSLIARAELRGGPVCVKQARPRLQVAAEWHAPVERSRAEVAWLRFAARLSPQSVPAVIGEDAASFAFAMTWLDPDRYRNWKTELSAGRTDPAFAARVGAALAGFHLATAGRPDVERAFDNRASFRALRLDPYFAAAAGVHPGRAGILQRLIERTGDSRVAVMHGDVSPKNLLIGPDGPVFLDAECACCGDPAFDAAFCLAHLLLKGAWKPQWREAFLACFDALAEAYLDRAAWEPRGGLEPRIAGLLGALLLARVDGKSPVEYLASETARAPVRRFALEILADPPARLAEIASAWRSLPLEAPAPPTGVPSGHPATGRPA